MTTKRQLKKLFEVILTEVGSNPSFAESVQAVLGGLESSKSSPKKRHRRSPAVIDPIEILGNAGHIELRAALEALDVEQLKDVVAQYGMDPAKLVMKLKDKPRIVEHIMTSADQRFRKGDAFRGTMNVGDEKTRDGGDKVVNDRLAPKK